VASPNITYERDQKHAVIDAASAGDNTIVAAVTGKKILVTSYLIVASGGANTNLRFGGCFAPTAAGALLNLQITAATSVDGHLTYVEID
jgi:hypothetical protein